MEITLNTYGALLEIEGRTLELLKNGGTASDDVAHALWQDISAIKCNLEKEGCCADIRRRLRAAWHAMGTVYALANVPAAQQMHIALAYGALCGASSAAGVLFEQRKGGRA